MSEWDTYCYSGRGAPAVNEDRVAEYASNRSALWLLADGLGGHGCGEIASAEALSSILQKAQKGVYDLQELARCANEKILALQKDQQKGLPMRCTLVAALGREESFQWGHVGDSRLYYFRDGRIIAQTRDDSVSQLAVSLGELEPDWLRGSPDQNRLTHALGEEPLVFHLAAAVRPQPGDAFLLCSDGFWKGVWETEMLLDLCKSYSAREWGELMLCRVLAGPTMPEDNFTLLCGFYQNRDFGP